MVTFCCLIVFWLFWLSLTNGTLYQSSKTLKTIGVPIVIGLRRLYQQCTNGVPIVRNSQKQSKDSQKSKMTIGVPIVTCPPRQYQQCTNRVPIVKNSQKQSKNSQNSKKWPLDYQSSHVYQDCTNRVPTVYQKQPKDSQNSKNDHWCTIVTGLPRLYQQCNNSLLIVNKNLAIANRSRVSCAHNALRAFIDLNITPWPWNLGSLKVTGNGTTGQIIHDLLLVELFDVK